ncbi:ribonuclease HI [Nitrosomonas sp. Is37]|uniref:ribonuclease HI n=1 Tax=Nitrosomonas sp. Is37 TaxID=3080535 RepID=UPI00294B59D8|nr:RNase H family protein [Nitrosomonas sp. Is37]MDV6345299.1 RNase H family protein [Nitrosomonas sp. Is37]
MNHLHIFTDGSVHTQSKVGYGAYLVVADLATPMESLKDSVKVKRFEQTSSTRLELQTLLWALNETISLTDSGEMTLTIYTDSQNIISLPGRRIRLEQNDYFTSKNKRLNNYELYQEFYRLNAKLNCRFVKVTGHQPSSQKDEIGKLFSLVDRASRRALRENF